MFNSTTHLRQTAAGEEKAKEYEFQLHRASPLTAVELVGVGVLLGLLVRSIGVGVGDAAGLAELASARHVQDVDEEGRGGGGQDEAVLGGH